MKARVLATTIVGLLVAGSAFAGELGVKGTYTDSINLGGRDASTAKGNAKTYTYTKGRIDFKVKANDQTTFFVETKLESAFAIDYVYADIAMFDSKLRVGTITDGTGTFTGGIYQSPCFQALTRSKGNGVSYSTKFDTINLNFTNIGAALNDDSVRVYSAKADTKIDDATVSGILKYGMAANTARETKQAVAVELEGTYKIGDGKLSAQYYMDVNDGAANIFNYGGAASSVVGVNKAVLKKESFLAVYGEYSLAPITTISGLGVYVDYVMAMNDDTKAQWNPTYKTKAEQGSVAATILGKASKGTSSRTAIGARCDLNDVSTVFYEMVSTTPVDGNGVGSSTLGLQVKF